MSKDVGERKSHDLGEGSAATRRGMDKTLRPRELMHTELCAWRFGGKCDCGKEETDV